MRQSATLALAGSSEKSGTPQQTKQAVAQGDVAGAQASYCNTLKIREALTARDPANIQWQRVLTPTLE